VYKINRSKLKTKEEKVAERITVLLSDFNLDLERVGYYIARDTPYVIFSRAIEVLESAQFQKPIVDEVRNGIYDDRLFK
jgi:hypothetical protein